MKPGAQGSHCDRCDKTVHDLTAMTAAEAGGLLARNNGKKICVRYRVRRDGSLRFRSPPPAAKGSALLAIAGMAAACTGHAPQAAALETPEAVLCEDADGYSVPCADLERLPSSEPSTPIAFEQLEPFEPAELVPQSEVPALPPSCPLPDPDEEYELLGGVDPDFDAAERHTLLNDARREAQRSDRRAARQQQRRARRLTRQ